MGKYNTLQTSFDFLYFLVVLGLELEAPHLARQVLCHLSHAPSLIITLNKFVTSMAVTEGSQNLLDSVP
jgi:hypothetical protein